MDEENLKPSRDATKLQDAYNRGLKQGKFEERERYNEAIVLIADVAGLNENMSSTEDMLDLAQRAEVILEALKEIKMEELVKIRKRERKAIRTLRGKALCVIDMLITNNAGDEDDKFLSLIYRIAHSASGTCGNPHETWQEEIHKLYQSLRAMK